MEMMDDTLADEIISRLPLKFAVQCKVLSKNFKDRISAPEFSQILFQREKDRSTQFIYPVNSLFRKLHKISLRPIPITHIAKYFSNEIDLLALRNGLILFDFQDIKVYCVFNPATGAHQLIPRPQSTNEFAKIGFAVDYPDLDQYKLVTISEVVENSNLFYKFYLLSSDRSGLWREVQLRTNTFISFFWENPPVYWHGSLYWLRSDGSVLAFDTTREEAILIDRPEFIDSFDLSHDKIITGRNIWLGIAQGLLTLVCIFKKCIVIGAYDNASSAWRISDTLDNLFSIPDDIINRSNSDDDPTGLGPNDIVNGFPVWIDSKRVSFVVEERAGDYVLYEYDTLINGYRNTAVLHQVNCPMYCFHPTLASVHRTPSNNVNTADLAYIAAKLHDVRRFIIEDESLSSSSSSSSSEQEEEEEQAAQAEEQAAQAEEQEEEEEQEEQAAQVEQEEEQEQEDEQ